MEKLNFIWDKKVKIFLFILACILVILIILLFIALSVKSSKSTLFCISNEVQDLNVQCSSNEECLSYFFNSLDDDSRYNSLEEDVKNQVGAVLSKALFCQGNCKIRKVSVISYQSINQDSSICSGQSLDTKLPYKKVNELIEFLNA
jgi:uncharacterized protein YpmS